MRRLLVVVDMQNDFIDGSLGSPMALSVVKPVAEKIEEYLRAGDNVIFTLDTHGEDYLETLEGKHLPVVHCVKGTLGWELHESLKGYPGERIEKNTFGSMELARIAAERDYGSVELAGLCTDICVISNALLVKAAAPSTPVKVDPACCAGVTEESHKNALEAMRACQVEII